jgi:radical SAM superfamily enzyme YgiQ (UPF0313 family)
MSRFSRSLMGNDCDILLVAYEGEENLSVCSLAAFLVDKGLSIAIEPYMESRKEDILRTIIDRRPKIVGFSIAFQAMIGGFAELADHLRRNGVEAHFTAGGHIPTIAPEQTFEILPGLDTIIRHEGEHTLLELYESLDQPDRWPSIRGLVHRRDGVTRAAPPRPLIQNLDSLPFPVRPATLQTIRGLGVCSILASRGCNYNCSFCSIHQFYSDALGPKHRLRSPATVAQEMEQLFSRGARIFIFDDDDLGAKSVSERRWIEEFARELERRGLGDEILWSIFCRVDEVDADLLGRFKRCGLAFICMGIESGNEQGLKLFNKHFTVESVFRAVRALHDLGVGFEYGFMMFDPGSSFQSVRSNVEFLEELCIDGRVPVRFAKMVPLIGTPITRSLAEDGRLRGPITAPDYSFEDERLDLLELFWGRSFGMAFRRKGLVDRFRSARKDAVIVKKFFPDRYTPAFSESVTTLIKTFNDSAFETMHKALRFMEQKSYDDILYYWSILDMLSKQELDIQSRIGAALDKLVYAENSA